MPSLILIIISLLAWYPIFSQAEYKNPVCEIYMLKVEFQKYSYVSKDLKRLLHEKQYELNILPSGPQYKIGAGRDYLNWEANKSAGPFSPCIAKLQLRRTKTVIIQDSDPIIWTAQAKRRLPRSSFKGTARCKYAIKDALSQLPKCK